MTPVKLTGFSTHKVSSRWNRAHISELFVFTNIRFGPRTMKLIHEKIIKGHSKLNVSMLNQHISKETTIIVLPQV